MGEYGKALPYFEKALAMKERLYPPDQYNHGHPSLATSLSNLGVLLQAMGEYGKALPYNEKALAMFERLYPPDQYKHGHRSLAIALHNMGFLLQVMREYDKALPYFQKALAMFERLYPPDQFENGHPELVNSISGLGALLDSMGDSAKAMLYYENKRLYPLDQYKDGHPSLARSLNNLGTLLQDMGKYGEALPYYEKALAMNERLYPPDTYKDGHPDLALNINNLGALFKAREENSKALSYFKRGLEFHTRQTAREMLSAPEASALAFLRTLPTIRDAYLFTALGVTEEPVSSVFTRVWPTKGPLLQLASRRHQGALVATAGSTEARAVWQRLVDVRGQLNRLAVEPGANSDERDRRLVPLATEQERLERDLVKYLPALDRHTGLADLGPKNLHAKLEPSTAFIDLFHHAEWEKGELVGYRYQAFVLAPGQDVQRIDLKDAKPIDDSIASWLLSIGRGEDSPAPARLKQLVWDKLAAALPPGTTIVYLCPEGDLTRLPWAALPGSKPNTVLLEDVAVAVVPSGSWLLEQLIYPQKETPGADAPGLAILAVDAIDYGKAPEGQQAKYIPLAETGHEMKRVLEAFGVTYVLQGAAATPAALKERLAKVRYAHFATHGYFDAAAVTAEARRQKEQMEKWRFGLERTTARVGVRQHPFGLVGLALAGANDPKNAGPDGGILTGLGIVDLPLETLKLCVLSACETGLGELTEGESVVGLQRAFHVAGCPNVIGSLWKVDDAATAALMTQFYYELRVKKRPPLLALQHAQLTIYRHPDRIAALAGPRARPDPNAAAALGSTAVSKPGEKRKTTPTILWVAFVLSGVGR